jgi:membrane-associated phospholipid phosphatase
MEEFLGLQTWGTDLILWIQSFHNSFLDAFFLAITWLGNPEAYVVLLALIYWCVNRQWGQRMIVLVMTSAWINEVVKTLLRLPRPDPARVRVLAQGTTFGFPSGHAQTPGVIFWGYLAARVRQSWFTVVALVMIFLMGLSRIYLGAHFPQDVIGGWVIGIVVLLVWLRYEDRLAARWHALSTGQQVALSVIAPLLMLLAVPPDFYGHYPNENAGTISGILLGAGLGAILEERTVRFRVAGSLARRTARYLVGAILVGALYIGGALLPELEPWGLDIALRVLRYGLVGLAAVWLAPWLFVRLKLAGSDLAPTR